MRGNRRKRFHQRPKKSGAPQTNEKPPLKNVGRVIESHKPKRYGILFFETFMQAKTSKEQITEAARQVEQLNIVIKAEGDMNDPELREFGMVYAGAAWHLIHTRRVDEGWYTAPR